MGNFTLGRLGLDVVMDTANGPDRWEIDGDRIRFRADLRASNLLDAKFARFQALGLANNPDEPFVPFTWTEDAVAWDMMVRVDSVRVSTVPSSFNANWFPAEFEITRMPSANAPLIESRLLGACRTNSHAVTNGVTVAWWATPAAATMDFLGLAAGGVAPTATTRTAETGAMTVQYTPTGAVFLDGAFTFQCSPSDWYDGAAKVELTGDGGTTYRTITGRQLLNLPTYWRINNGLVRVSYGGGAGLFTVQHYVGGSWITAKTYRIFDTAGASVGSAVGGTPNTVTILRNSPECVSVRIGWEYSTTYPSPIYLDLTLRRGAMWVDGALVITEAFVDLLDSLSKYIGIGRNTAEAATTHTSGLHATSADADGGKYTMSTSVAKGNDTTQGAFWATTNAPVFPFMIGYEPGSAATIDTFMNQTHAWFAAASEVMRPVQR